MKVWITEYVESDKGILIGPYIRADSLEIANSVAIQHGLLVLGEFQELLYEPIKERVIH